MVVQLTYRKCISGPGKSGFWTKQGQSYMQQWKLSLVRLPLKENGNWGIKGVVKGLVVHMGKEQEKVYALQNFCTHDSRTMLCVIISFVATGPTQMSIASGSYPTAICSYGSSRPNDSI